MSEPVAQYHVAYSGTVRASLVALVTRARERGLDEQVLAAIREIDFRLHTYPQFGDPLQDLRLAPAQLWIGVVPPLVVHYLLHEAIRTVLVVTPFRTLPRSGLE